MILFFVLNRNNQACIYVCGLKDLNYHNKNDCIIRCDPKSTEKTRVNHAKNGCA